MIWDRRRRGDDLSEPIPPRHDSFGEVLEGAPIMALLLDADSRVIRANKAARDFFGRDQLALTGARAVLFGPLPRRGRQQVALPEWPGWALARTH